MHGRRTAASASSSTPFNKSVLVAWPHDYVTLWGSLPSCAPIANRRARRWQPPRRMTSCPTEWAHSNNYTWHHVENSTRMQLVPQSIYDEFPHTGGVSTAKQGIQ